MRRSITVWFAALAGLVILTVAADALRYRRAVHGYDVTRDQDFNFSRAKVRRIPVELHGGRLVVPGRPEPHDAVFLRLRVRSTPLGSWLEPRLQITAGDRTVTQAFERGGRGVRYVNLGPLVSNRPVPVVLAGQNLEIADQRATVLYVANDWHPRSQTILVISPHPDDAEIAAYNLYAGRNAYVLTVTAGEAGDAGMFAKFAGATAFREKGRERVWNSLVVPMLGGLSPERTANLGYFDGTLASMRAKPNVAVHSLYSGALSLDAYRQTLAQGLIPARPGGLATWSNLVQDLEYVVARVKPDVIVTPYPRLDAHPDHELSTFALIEALKDLNWKTGSLLLYTNHLTVSEMYPYGDAGDLVSLPPGVDGITFDGIVSDSLSPAAQARKYLALDAMVDLRPPSRPDSVSDTARAAGHALSMALFSDDRSYFRRAVRANELFFEVRVSSLYQPGITEDIEGRTPPPSTE
ncbi:MAG: PIG-L family deacetylase [Gammaproteobacteria bacterium]|nr:PIG-L family deacetylase [Gammaproteobacteria bacterium]